MQIALVVSLLTVVLGNLYVERLHQDVIKQVSVDQCAYYKGYYDKTTQLCTCPSDRPTFSQECRLIDTSTCGVVFQENLSELMRVFHEEIDLHVDNCPRATYSTLSEGNVWMDATKDVQIVFNISNKYSLTVSRNMRSFSGQLIRISHECGRKCVILKVKGLYKYDVPTSNKTRTFPSSKRSIHSTRRLTSSTSSSYWVKLGIIAAIVSIIMALCAIAAVVLHFCHSKVHCRRNPSELLKEEAVGEVDINMNVTDIQYQFS